MAHTLESVKAQLQADITASNNKTGASDTTVHDAMSRLIAGFESGSGGITPTGTKKLTSNGTHNVAEFEFAEVAVPASGITPIGTKEIVSNGEHDVTNFAKVLANIPTGLSAKIFTNTLTSDVTSGTATILGANDYIKSIKSNPNAFVLVRYLGLTTSVASSNFWFNANFPLGYSGTTKYNTIAYRQTASTASGAFNTQGLTGTNYGGHITVNANGGITCSINASFPVKAGEYQIIAGTVEML